MSKDQPAQAPSALPLRCLGGQPAPPEIGADLAVLPALPVAARRQLYRVLGPCLREPLPGNVDAQIHQFCQELQVDAALLARVIRASRFLLRHASLAGLSEADLAEDLATLGDTGEIRATLLPGYETVKKVVRSEAVRGALTDHGKVVERVAWRVDHVSSSNRGDGMNVPVAVVSLWYREGDREGQVTLQLPPDTVQELRAMCDRFP